MSFINVVSGRYEEQNGDKLSTRAAEASQSLSGFTYGQECQYTSDTVVRASNGLTPFDGPLESTDVYRGSPAGTYRCNWLASK